MKYGVKDAVHLSRTTMVNILDSIIAAYVEHDGDNLAELSTSVIDTLISNKLIAHGTVRHVERPDLEHITKLYPENRDKCCLHCQHSYESETEKGDWKLYCFYNHRNCMVKTFNVCNDFQKYEKRFKGCYY